MTRVGRSRLMWFLVGMSAGLALQAIQAQQLGGWAGLLEVGESATIRSYIEDRLPGVPTVPGGGHDGQLSFLIASDLDGSEASDLIDGAGYRYRRILYPFTASLGGALEGQALLWAMILVASAGMGLATAAAADLASSLKGSAWATAGVLANPGMWLAVQLLTPDALGIGLALSGLALWFRRRPIVAVVLFAAAGLTKEQYLLIPVALAAYELIMRANARTTALLASSMVPTLTWGFVVNRLVGEGLTARGNLAMPLVGIVESARGWGSVPPRDLMLGVLALAGLLGAAWAILAWRRHPLGWILGAWVLLGVLSSRWVWGFGNNAARVFAIIWTLVALAFSVPGRRPTADQIRTAGASGGFQASTSRRNLPV